MAGTEDTCCDMHHVDRQWRGKGERHGLTSPAGSQNSKVIKSEVSMKNESRHKPSWASLLSS